MKRIIRITAAVLALACVIAFAACGKTNEGTAPANTLPSSRDTKKHADRDDARVNPIGESLDKTIAKGLCASDFPLKLTVDDCFKNGYYYFAVSEDMEISADFGGENAIEWTLYVLDGLFNKELKALEYENKPIRIGSGESFSVKAGQYVYVYCPVNSLVTDKPSDAAPLTLTAKAA